MIVFQYVRWKNLLSTGSEWVEIDFLKSDMTMIVGRNGHGKSTLLDAVCFGLFGKPFRNVTKNQLLNSVNNKDLCVEISFSRGSKNYKVVRGIKPSIFDIYVDGEKLDQEANVRDTQEYLESNILKFNMKAFTQIDILGSATFVPFMQLPAANRREIVEDLLDINVFGVMNTILKERIKTLNDELVSIEADNRTTREKIEFLEDAILKISSSRDAAITAQQIALKQASKEVEEAQALVDEKSTIIDSLVWQDTTDLTAKKRELIKATSQISGKMSNTKEQIQFLEKHDNCPTCEQCLEHDFKEGKLASLYEELNQFTELNEKLKAKLTKVEEQLNRAEDTNRRNDNEKRSLDPLLKSLSLCQKNVESAKANLERLIKESQKTSDEEQDQLLKQRDKLVNIQELLDHKKLQKSDFDMCLKLLKDNGIKTSVVKKYLPVINQKVNEYLAAMDFFVQFELDETFNETIRSRFRDVFSYASFSEGEKQRINLALLFTWRSIAKLRNNHNTNLLLMDETLDGSLDQAATDSLLDILENESKTNGTRIFVITHSPDAYRERFDRTLKFEKKDNFSFMTEES